MESGRAPLLAIAAIVIVVAGLLTPSLARPAFACTARPELDPVAESHLIVAGRVTGWRLGDPQPAAPPPSNFATAPLTITIRVDRALKGSAGSEVDFDDSGSRWAAEQAASRYPTYRFGVLGCTAFDADPSGRYAILGLTQRADGTYVASAFLVFFIGDAPAGPDYERALERLGWAGPMELPSPEKDGE